MLSAAVHEDHLDVPRDLSAAVWARLQDSSTHDWDMPTVVTIESRIAHPIHRQRVSFRRSIRELSASASVFGSFDPFANSELSRRLGRP